MFKQKRLKSKQHDQRRQPKQCNHQNATRGRQIVSQSAAGAQSSTEEDQTIIDIPRTAYLPAAFFLLLGAEAAAAVAAVASAISSLETHADP